MTNEHGEQIRIVQETVAGKEITFAHVMGGPDPIIYQKLDVLPDEITEITVESTDGKEFTLTQTFSESSKEGKSGYLLYVIAIDTSEELSVATPKINIITK